MNERHNYITGSYFDFFLDVAIWDRFIALMGGEISSHCLLRTGGHLVQVKYKEIYHGGSSGWMLKTGGHWVEVAGKTGLTVSSMIKDIHLPLTKMVTQN